MKKCIDSILIIVLWSHPIIYASDNTLTQLISPRDTRITQILGSNNIPLSLLVKLMGYHKACSYQRLSISETAWNLFKTLSVCPKDIQNTILNKLQLFMTDQWHHYYAHGFQKRTLSIPTDAACIPMIHLLDNNTLAINTRCNEPVRIWSLEKKPSLLFESTYKSKLASCYFESNEQLVSLHHTGNAFNVLRKNETGWLDSTTAPIINPNSSIINFIPHNNSLITRNLGDHLDMYNLEVPSHIKSYANAHTDYISCGIPVSEHVFATGSYDGTIKTWDIRTHSASMGVSVSSNAAPYALRLFDSNNILVGTNKKCALRNIDMRKPELCTYAYEKDPVYDLMILKNGSLALCAGHDVDFVDLANVNNTTTRRTIPNLEAPLAIAKASDDTLAIADVKSRLFMLKPLTQHQLTEDLFLSNTLLCIALDAKPSE